MSEVWRLARRPLQLCGDSNLLERFVEFERGSPEVISLTPNAEQPQCGAVCSCAANDSNTDDEVGKERADTCPGEGQKMSGGMLTHVIVVCPI